MIKQIYSSHPDNLVHLCKKKYKNYIPTLKSTIFKTNNSFILSAGIQFLLQIKGTLCRYSYPKNEMKVQKLFIS